MASRGGAPTGGVAHGLIDNFFLSLAELEDSPSRRDGVDSETEVQLRVFGCESIQRAVLQLKAPQAVAATGQVLLHRFYCKRSLKDFDVKEVARAATYLASKMEEWPAGRALVILRVFRCIDSRREGRAFESLQSYSQEYAVLKQRMLTVESHMLRALGFVVHVEHPHKFVLSLLVMMDMPPHVQQYAWNLANDSLRSTLCVRFKNETLACGIAFMAAHRCKVALPENVDERLGCWRHWWTVLAVPDSDVYTVARELHELHTLPKATYVRLERVPLRDPVIARAALASEASPMSQPAVEGAANAGAGGKGGRVANGGACEMLSASGGSGSREASHTGERRPGSNGDSRGASERCAPAEPGSKRTREAPALEKEIKRRRSSPSEAGSEREPPAEPHRREDRSDRGADRGRLERNSNRTREAGDRERERQRGEYAKDAYREERSRHREEGGRGSDSRSRNAWPTDRGTDRPEGRTNYPDKERSQQRSRPPSVSRSGRPALSERDRPPDRERGPRPDSGTAASVRPLTPSAERPPSRSATSERGKLPESHPLEQQLPRSHSPQDHGSASKLARDAVSAQQGPPPQRPRVVFPTRLSPSPKVTPLPSGDAAASAPAATVTLHAAVVVRSSSASPAGNEVDPVGEAPPNVEVGDMSSSPGRLRAWLLRSREGNK